MKNKSGFILNLIAMIYILFSGIGIGVSNKLPWWLMFLAIIVFIITTILDRLRESYNIQRFTCEVVTDNGKGGAVNPPITKRRTDRT